MAWLGCDQRSLGALSCDSNIPFGSPQEWSIFFGLDRGQVTRDYFWHSRLPICHVLDCAQQPNSGSLFRWFLNRTLSPRTTDSFSDCHRAAIKN